MKVKMLSKVVNDAKAVAKDYATYYKTANDAAKKFKKNHPVVNVVGGIALGLAMVYVSNPEECDELINSAKDGIKKKVSEFKKEHKKNLPNIAVSAVTMEQYEAAVTSITDVDILVNELKTIKDIRNSSDVTLMFAIEQRENALKNRIAELLCKE